MFDKQILYPGEMPGHNFQTRLEQFKRKFKTVVDWTMPEDSEVEEHKQKQKLAPSKQKEAKVREKFMNEDCGICKVPRNRCCC